MTTALQRSSGGTGGGKALQKQPEQPERWLTAS